MNSISSHTSFYYGDLYERSCVKEDLRIEKEAKYCVDLTSAEGNDVVFLKNSYREVRSKFSVCADNKTLVHKDTKEKITMLTTHFLTGIFYQAFNRGFNLAYFLKENSQVESSKKSPIAVLKMDVYFAYFLYHKKQIKILFLCDINKNTLGEGAAGNVYKIYEITTGKFYAAKMANQANNVDTNPALQLEFNASQAINREIRQIHPNIALQNEFFYVVDIVQTPRRLALVGELFDGSLKHLLSKGTKFTLLERVGLCFELLKNYLLITQSNWIIQDLKSRNIFFKRNSDSSVTLYFADLDSARKTSEFITSLESIFITSTPITELNKIAFTIAGTVTYQSIYDRVLLGSVRERIKAIILKHKEEKSSALNEFNEKFEDLYISPWLTQNVFALGTMCYEIMTDGKRPYELQPPGHPVDNMDIKTLDSSLTKLSNNVTVNNLVVHLIQNMTRQIPDHRNNLDLIKNLWEEALNLLENNADNESIEQLDKKIITLDEITTKSFKPNIIHTILTWEFSHTYLNICHAPNKGLKPNNLIAIVNSNNTYNFGILLEITKPKSEYEEAKALVFYKNKQTKLIPLNYCYPVDFGVVEKEIEKREQSKAISNSSSD